MNYNHRGRFVNVVESLVHPFCDFESPKTLWDYFIIAWYPAGLLKTGGFTQVLHASLNRYPAV
jgi:hypothetical protein